MHIHIGVHHLMSFTVMEGNSTITNDQTHLTDVNVLEYAISTILARLFICQSVERCPDCKKHAGEYVCCATERDMDFSTHGCGHEHHISKISPKTQRVIMRETLESPFTPCSIESGLELFQDSELYQFDIPVDVASFIAKNRVRLQKLAFEMYTIITTEPFFIAKSPFEKFLNHLRTLAHQWDCGHNYDYFCNSDSEDE